MARRFFTAAALMGLMCVGGQALAQTAPEAPPANPPAQGQAGGDQGGGRGNRGNWNPEEFRKRMMDRFKEDLKSPDEEWAVLQPKLEKVMTAMAESRFAGMGGRGGFGGPGGPGGGRGGRGGAENGNANQPLQPESEMAVASRDLRTVLANENASADEIAMKLKTFREARAKAEEKLKAAQKELQEVVTERQEAMLVMRGMLQ
jgi:hypothetical protein